MELTQLTVPQRSTLIEQIIATAEKRFYDPNLHGANLRAAFETRMHELLECPEREFPREVEQTLSVLRANPLKFYHRSQQRVPARWAIRSTFRKLQENSHCHWMFQDVAPSGPAYDAGLSTGDILVGLNGQSHIESPDLSVGGNELVVRKRDGSVVRNDFVAPSRPPVRAVFHSKLGDDIGYVRLTHLPGLIGIDLARDIDVAIAEINDCDRLIVDLRGNPGGGTGGLRLMSYLTPDKIPVGYSLTRPGAESGYRPEQLTKFRRIPSRKWTLPLLALKYRFIDHSIVVVTEGLGKQRFHGRIVILVNEHTISGAEIIAGFAADHGLATIVGTKTAGTLLGWRSFPLEFGYVLVIPTGNYLTWDGKSFETIGVQSNIDVDFDPNAAREGVDVQLQCATNLVRGF